MQRQCNALFLLWVDSRSTFVGRTNQKTDNGMKKLVIIVISLMCVSVASAKKVKTEQVDGGVKFHIEDRDIPTDPLPRIAGRQCWEKILKESEIAASNYNIRHLSQVSDSLVCFDRNACFEGFLTAYDKHYSLVLSPDMIWLLISQGIATHINEHAEELRDRLVGFDGQKTLNIKFEGEGLLKHPEYWDWIVPAFSDSIDNNMKSEFSDLMVCNFSTTGAVERITSQITMMESVKKYFKYELQESGCGIPDITLLGTTDDWTEIRSRINRLDYLDLGWWREKLEPVLDEFVKASEGKVNRKFWLDMVDQYSPQKRVPAMCGSNGIIPAKYNGWFTVFFPFCKDSDDKIFRTPELVTHNTDVCPEIKKVDVRYTWQDPITLIEERHELELWAGFIGMEMDWETRTLKPAMSWMVREKPESDLYLDKLTPAEQTFIRSSKKIRFINSGILEEIFGNSDTWYIMGLPSGSMLEKYPQGYKRNSLVFISLERITVPYDLGEWCSKFGIESVTIKAPMTDEQKADILRQVPTATVVQL